MMLDFERKRLAEIGREIASDFKQLRVDARESEGPDLVARYSHMFGALKVICAWLHDHLVEEVDAATVEAIGHFNMLDDSGGVQ